MDALTRAQYGLLTWDQGVELLGPDRLQYWIETRRLIRVHRRVYRVAGAPITWHQRLLAAVLAAGEGAVASHRAAAYLWALIEAEPPIEISVPMPRRPHLAAVIVHRSRDLGRARVHLRHRIPTTSPMRALIDLGAVEREPIVRDALERGLTARRYSVPAVEWARAEVSRPGRRGSGVLGRILDERALGAEPADGLLEPRFARLARVFVLPAYEFQCAIGPYEVDFAWLEARLVVEVDGWETHGSPEAMQRDLERQNYLVGLGWTVLRFTWQDVVRRPDHVARQIRRALARCIPESIQSWS